MHSEKTTTVSILLDEECNRLLEASKARSGRAKRQEAGQRLKDHLLRFGESWQPLMVSRDTDDTPT